METTQIILIIAAIILSFMALKLVTKILFRLIIILITIVLFFMGYQHFSGTNIIDETKKFCNNNSQPIKCTCFFKPIYSDLTSRFSEEEIDLLKTNKLKSNIEFGKSYKIKEKEIKKCFEDIGQTTILEEVLKDIKLIYSRKKEE